MGSAPEAEGALSGAFVASGRVISAKRVGKAPRVAFLANDDTIVPAAVVAMQHAGLAQILLEGGSAWPRSAPVKTVAISEGLHVDFGAAQYLHPDGTAGFRVDGVFGSSGETGARVGRHVLGMLGNKGPQARSGYQLINAVVPVRDAKPRKEMAPPDASWRMVSVIKYWSTVRKVVPPEHLPPEWDRALVSAVDAMDDAKTSGAYIRVLMTMAAALNDGHAKVMGRLARETMGDAQVAVQLASVEGRAVVVKASALPSGDGSVHVGDEVLAIDGISVKDRVAQVMPLVGASTPAGRDRDALQMILRGPAGKTVRLTVSDASGQTRDVAMAYVKNEAVMPGQREPYRRLNEHVGYVNMAQLQRGEIQRMFEQLGSCDALIFDLRGYPNGTAWEIASRLDGSPARQVTSRGNIVTSASVAPAGLSYSDGVGKSKGEPYRGNVIVLVNEETQSQAEHSVLLFEAAAKVTVVGSQTAGSDGDLAVDVLPGGVYVSMTGFDVRHPDGASVQGVGIVPDVQVSPTVRGIREGRDEVLEAALRIAGDPGEYCPLFGRAASIRPLPQ
jgi:C-terminal processing protease CtpA/Prc